jgi:phospholipid/cholesterol/gamma-HCH transport system substrate-binding protein
MENKAHAIAAGAFVLLIGAMLIALAVWLTQDSAVRQRYEISTRESVSGLQPQAAVRYRGIDVGKVVHIGFDPQTAGNVLVRIAVDERAPVTKSTFATLGYQGVTGLAFVQLDDDGEASERLLGDSGSPPRIPMRPSLISKLTDQGAEILTQVQEAMVQAKETMVKISALLSAENQATLVTTVANLGTAASGFSTASNHVEQVAAEARKTLRAIESTSTEMMKTAVEARTVAVDFSRSIQRISDTFGETTNALVSAAHQFNVTTLPRVHRVSDDTSTTMRQATSVLTQFNDNPQSLLYGSGAIPPGPGEPGFVAPGRMP